MLNFLKKSQSSNPPLGGRYQVIQQLGKGGFGQTFLAQDLHLPGHPVCVIKQLDPQVSDAASLKTARRLFDTEAEVLYALGNHDQIPRLMAHFEDNQEFYLAQEYIDSEPLNRVLVDGDPWPQGRVIALLQDILQVLAFVHHKDVIHRDIKPANLLCRHKDGRIVLIDFGAVKQVNTQFLSPQTGQTNLTVSIGTQGYMPNEQLGGNPRFSSDVYAVGMIGIQALTGVHPRHLNHNHRTSELEWHNVNPSVDAALADVLDRMICYDFRARYPTAAEALAALQALPSALRETMPERWYSPKQADSPRTLEPTLGSNPANEDTWGIERQASPQSGESLTPSDSPSQATLAAVGQHQTGHFSYAQKPGGSTLVLSSVLQTLPERRWWWLGMLASLGMMLFVVRTCSSPQLANQAAMPLPQTPQTDADSSGQTDELQDQASPPLPQTPPIDAELLSQADELRDSGQYQDALVMYDQAIADQPDSAAAHWGRCYSLNQLQQAESAISACDQAIALNQDDPRPLSSKGFALQQQQRHTEALALFDQAIELEPDNAEAWNNRGATLLQLKQPEEALKAFDQAIQLQADLAEAWNNKGAALWSLQHFDRAIAAVDQAITLNPDYADALSLRQQMREKLGR
ncbi:MAG: serine/threonine-protein kinase [Cyanobacteria bacterium J06635_15]